MLLKKIYLLICSDNGLCLQTLSHFDWSITSLQWQEKIESVESLPSNATLYFSQLTQKYHHIPFDEINKLDTFLTDTYLLIPDNWTQKVTSSVDLVPSEQVRNLAGLALASEASHLAPELVCYRFSVDQQQAMSVVACPLSILNYVEEFLHNKVSIKGVITFDDCRTFFTEQEKPKHLSSTLTKLSLTSYPQKVANTDNRHQRWFFLFMLVLMSQLGMLALHQYKTSLVEEDQYLLLETQQTAISLAPFMANPAHEVAEEVIRILPVAIRFNGFYSQHDVVHLSLTADTRLLKQVLVSWRSRWPDFLFQRHEPATEENIELLIDLNQQKRTRSVQDVVIEIRPLV